MLAMRDRMIEEGLVKKGELTTHGFRSAFKSWASDQTSAEHAVVEACLAHKVSSAVERAYLRSDFYEKRRRLMQSWAEFIENKACSNVIALSGAR
jgi:integrase